MLGDNACEGVVCWPPTDLGFGPGSLGEAYMQTARPRDIGALVLVVGLFLILFFVSLTVGSPVR